MLRNETQLTLTLGQLLKVTSSIHRPCSLLTSFQDQGWMAYYQTKITSALIATFYLANPRKHVLYPLVWSLGSALSRELFCPCNPLVTHVTIIPVGPTKETVLLSGSWVFQNPCFATCQETECNKMQFHYLQSWRTHMICDVVRFFVARKKTWH